MAEKPKKLLSNLKLNKNLKSYKLDKNQLKEKSKRLESIFIKKDQTSEKLILQKEMTFMRKQLKKSKTNLSITYPVNPPFAFVNIVFNKQDSEFNYKVLEPKLREDEEEKLESIRSKIENIMDQEEIPIDEEQIFTRSKKLNDYLKKRFHDVIELFDIHVEEKRKPILFYYLSRNMFGMGRSDPVINDPFVEDIGCNGPKVPIYLYHRVLGSMKTNVIYPGELELNRFILKLAQISGRHISVYQPILDAVLSDGSRINLTLGSEVTRKGSTFTIRKFSYDPISPIDLMRFGSVSPLELAYLWLLIEHKKSVLISGGTASGKTTLLNSLCMFVRPEDKIVSIEDTPEIHIDHENWIQSVSRKGYGKVSGLSGLSGISGMSGISGGSGPGDVDLFDLLVAALRQRPEYVIVGEIRGREAFTLFQAIAVGHSSMSTVHAGTIDELLHRVENEPMNIPRVLFQSIDAVVLIGQVNVGDQRVRRTKHLVEVLDLDSDTNDILTNNVFNWNPKGDFFHYTGRTFVLENIAKETGKEFNAIFNELKRRENYLKMMDQKNINYYKDVSNAINQYYVEPMKATQQLKKR